MRAPKHDWHLMDADLGLEVRQATNLFRKNRWDVRDRDGNVYKLDDTWFNRLRMDPEWVMTHEELRDG